MGKTLHHESTGIKGAVASLALRVHHILSNKGTEENLLYGVWHNKAWKEVTSRDIVKAVRTASKILKLKEKGIDPDVIGLNSLQAGGDMALKIIGYKYSTIKNFGRWTSDTWQIYIHGQITNLLEGVAQKMSTPILYQKLLSLSHVNDNNESLETSFINATGQRRHWRNDPCTNE